MPIFQSRFRVGKEEEHFYAAYHSSDFEDHRNPASLSAGFLASMPVSDSLCTDFL